MVVVMVGGGGGRGNQAGKGTKGLLLEKSADMSDNKDKKKPISRSSRAGLQVCFLSIVGHMCVWICMCMYVCECVSLTPSLFSLVQRLP
jgi:hypothetical protein